MAAVNLLKVQSPVVRRRDSFGVLSSFMAAGVLATFMVI